MKLVYAALQGVEFEHRNDADKDSLIEIDNVGDSGYDVPGIPTGDRAFPGTWVALNKTVGGNVCSFLADQVKEKAK